VVYISLGTREEDSDVRFRPKADIPSCTTHVCFRGKADIRLAPITVFIGSLGRRCAKGCLLVGHHVRSMIRDKPRHDIRHPSIAR
jgi:hypothetical protein